MSHQNLLRIARDLDGMGVDTRVLHDLEAELAIIEAPPGVLGRMSAKVRGLAKRQWGHVVGELHESKELAALIKARVTNERPLSDSEQAKIKSQLADMLRVVPAGFIAATNSVLPLPGTSMLTPWLLVKLGLMPSRWREAHILAQLRQEAKRLRESGHAAEAERVSTLRHQIETESDARETAGRDAALLTQWDKNGNGEWDEEERRAYKVALHTLHAKALEHSSEERWFLQLDGQIMGPVTLDKLLGKNLDGALLVCFDGKSGWVALEPVLADLQ